MTPVTTPVPIAVHDGTGAGAPGLVLRTLPRGSCATCHLEWDITRGPLGPTELPVTPVIPPVIPPVAPKP